jgi:hypothetical protein
MTDIELLLLIIATFAGSIVDSLLGWADAGGNFNARKFLPSALRGAFSAVVVLLGTIYLYEGPIGLLLYVLAFFTGMGIDAGWNRLAGAVSK